MNPRTPEDHLREEYVSLLPHLRLAAEELEAEVHYVLTPLIARWESHERILVKSRVKECESAIASLRRRHELWFFEKEPTGSLRMLNDLVGVRVLAFPKARVLDIDEALRDRLWDWVADPVPPIPGTANSLALKYHGYCKTHSNVRAEIQLMSMLVGMYWEVEHGTLYKPGDKLKGLEASLQMHSCNKEVLRAMQAFEDQFAKLTSPRPQNVPEQIEETEES
jgi:ppGpp synthetase/RelA/SpoT-type nucleotidyltranferase